MDDPAERQYISFVADYGESSGAFPSATYMFNDVDYDRTVSTATGDSIPMNGYGDTRAKFLSSRRAVRVVTANVAHVPTFKHNLFSVGAAAGQRHSVKFDKNACALQLKSRTSVCFPKFGSLFCIQPCPLSLPEHFFAVNASGLTPTAVRVAILMTHCSRRQPSKLALFWKGRCTNEKGVGRQKGSKTPLHGRYTSEQIRNSEGCLST